MTAVAEVVDIGQIVSRIDGMASVGISGVIWCDQCGTLRDEPCWDHALPIVDAVTDLSSASLPSCLTFKVLDDSGEKVVCANRTIPVQSVFGPLIAPCTIAPIGQENVKFVVHVPGIGAKLYHLENDNLCNWMKWVRQAESDKDKNLEACIRDEQIYFVSTKILAPGEELRLWHTRKPSDVESPSRAPGARRISARRDDGENFGADSEPENAASDDNYTPKKPKGKKKPKKKNAKSEIVSNSNFQTPITKKKRLRNRSKIPPEEKGMRRVYTFYCEQCSIYFDSAALLAMHMLIHKPLQEIDPSVQLACPKCGFSRQDHEVVIRHVRASHSRSKNDVEMPRRICPVCNHETYNLMKHMARKHKTERMQLQELDGQPFNFECSVCTMKFPTRATMISHKRTHTMKSPANTQCVICLKNFKTKGRELQNHVSEHLVNDRLPCRHCDKVYRRYESLSEHMRLYHDPSQVVSCPLCAKTLKNSVKLKVHMETHNPTQEYECDYPDCGKKFRTQRYLKYHVDYVHLKRLKRTGEKRKREDIVDVDPEAEWSESEHSSAS